MSSLYSPSFNLSPNRTSEDPLQQTYDAIVVGSAPPAAGPQNNSPKPA